MTISSLTKLVFPAPHFISTSTSTTTHHDSCSTMIPFGGQTTLPPLSGHREKRAAASPPSLYITHVRSHCCSTLNWRLGPVSLTFLQSSVFWLPGQPLSPQCYSPPFYLSLHSAFWTSDKGFWLLLLGPFLWWTSFLCSLKSPDPSHWQSNLPSHPVSLLEFKVFSNPLIFNWLSDHTTASPNHTIPEHLLARPDQISEVTSLGLSYLEVIWVLASSGLWNHPNPSFCSLATTLGSNF